MTNIEGKRVKKTTKMVRLRVKKDKNMENLLK